VPFAGVDTAAGAGFSPAGVSAAHSAVTSARNIATNRPAPDKLNGGKWRATDGFLTVCASIRFMSLWMQ
jgi:hypothetical protein